MRFSRLIFNNVVRSARTYGSYFLSSTFSVFVFFIFAMLTFHPQLKNGLGGSSADVSFLAGIGLRASQVLIVLLSFIFLWYSFWTFVKLRKRDLGVYLMLGMKPNDLRKVLFGENMMIGTGAAITGIGLGLIFSKAILVVIQNLLNLTEGLSFYFPLQGIMVTLIVYILLFLIVSFVMIIRIQTESLSELGKSDETPQPLPRAHPLLAVGSVLSLGIGYGLLAYFVQGPRSDFWLLLGCILFTVMGTFLFFNQGIVSFYSWCRKRSFYWNGKNMLLTSEGMYHAQNNGTMYALITCTASVALVGICITAALGSAENGSRNSITPAYVLTSQLEPQLTEQPVEKLGRQVFDRIEEEGYAAEYDKIMTYPLGYVPADMPEDQQEEELYYYAYLMKAADYNKLAKQMNMEELHPKKDEMLSTAPTLTEYNQIKEMGQADLITPVSGVFENGVRRELTQRTVPVHFQIAHAYRFFIASDELVDEAMSVQEAPAPSFFVVINFKEWQEAETMNSEILTLLQKSFDETNEKLERIYSEELSEKEREEKLLASGSQYFDYESRYQSWNRQRQANGLILMIGSLLGGVFFIFTASIMYFRLFGSLDKEGRYHQTLYQLGLQPKQRHRIVTQQMLLMYFAPLLLAVCHTAVAFWGINTLSGMNLWRYFGIICLSYLFMLTLLFLISRWRYLVHLDVRAENPQAY